LEDICAVHVHSGTDACERFRNACVDVDRAEQTGVGLEYGIEELGSVRETGSE
jgi:hypothetical protein